MLRKAIFLAVLLFAAALLIACSSNDDAPSPPAGAPELEISVGVVESLSGAAALYGNSVVRGIELAAKQINAAGEVRVDLRTEDDESRPDAGAAIVRDFVAEGVSAIIGPTLSNVALQAMPEAQSAGVPMLGATTTAAGLTDIGDYIFRIALTEAIVVPATIARVSKDVNLDGAVLVFDANDEFSRSSAAAMRAGMQAAGASIRLEIDVAREDIEDSIQALEGSQVRAFLVTPLVETAVRIVKAIREHGFENAAIIGGNSFNTPNIADLAGDDIEGAYVGAAWNPGVDDAASRRFVAAYEAEYGEAPDLFAAQGYVAMYVLVDAVKRAGSADAGAIRDALSQTRGLETPFGPLSMSGSREAEHTPVVQQYRAGQLVAVE